MIRVSDKHKDYDRCLNSTCRSSLCVNSVDKKVLISAYYGTGPTELDMEFHLRTVCQECAQRLKRNEDDLIDYAESFVEIKNLEYTFDEIEGKY